jgi:hypothetical protein
MLNLAKKELTTVQVAKNPSKHYAKTKKLDLEAGVLGEYFVFCESFLLKIKKERKEIVLDLFAFA